MFKVRDPSCAKGGFESWVLGSHYSRALGRIWLSSLPQGTRRSTFLT